MSKLDGTSDSIVAGRQLQAKRTEKQGLGFLHPPDFVSFCILVVVAPCMLRCRRGCLVIVTLVN
jgi:hypothetical protein